MTGTTLFTVKNVQEGLRGLWSDGVLTYVEPGGSVQADLSDADHKVAVATGYFEFSGGVLDHDRNGANGGSLPDAPPALTGKNKDDLLVIAKAEAVAIAKDADGKDIPIADATNKQIADAIAAKRAA